MIYLNNAATSYPKPLVVRQKVERYLVSPPYNTFRGGKEAFSQADDIHNARNQVCELLKAKHPNRLVFTSGATESLNLIIKHFSQKGGHIISTVIEHNSVIRPLMHAQKDNAISCSFVKCNAVGYIEPSDIEKEIRENTTAIIVSHASNVTGCLQDLESIGVVAKQHNLLFAVDCSQSAGYTELDINTWQADFTVAAGHKGLWGMQGIGLLYIAEGNNPDPYRIGGTGSRSDYLYQPKEWPLKYEAGTQNIPGIISLGAGVSFFLNNKEQLLKETEELFIYLKESLENIKGLSVISSLESIPVLSFNIIGCDPNETAYILAESFGIIVRGGLHCSPLIHEHIGTAPEGVVRISLSHFNTKEDVDALLKAVTQIAKTT